MSYNFSLMLSYLLFTRQELPNIEVKETQLCETVLLTSYVLTSVTRRKWEGQHFD
jgi:hypothetical protein